MIGRILGHFQVLEQLGEGTMGVVYRAHDSSLDRDVALKILPQELAEDDSRLRRFHREARALATVQHPSVAMIHGLEQSGSTHFLVLELIPGNTLEERLRTGPLPVTEALRAARQIAEGLAAAHAQGIVHRDLKPANVKIDGSGRVKVLDFGLAKALTSDKTGPAALDATVDDGTAAGVIVGTPRYMSPEQLRGEATDPRSDLWALGCVLFELLTGRPAFDATRSADLIAAILGREPDDTLLPTETPEPARALLRACLSKTVSGRPANAEAAATELAAALRAMGGAPARAPTRVTQVTFASGVESSPAWSPDGREIIYTREAGAVRRLYRQALTAEGGGAATRLTKSDHDEIHPTWSPDGRTVLFVRARESGRRFEPGDVFGAYVDPSDVWALDLASGRETRLLENAFNPAFSPDGKRIAVDASWAGPRRIWTAQANGRNPKQVTTDESEAIDHLRPRWSPDGKRIVFQNVERTKFDLRVARVSDGAATWITNDLFQDLAPCFSPDGRWIVFASAYRGGGVNLWRVPIDDAARPAGPPEPLTSGAGQDIEPAVSADGKRIAFATLRQNADLWKLPVDPRTGRATGLPSRVVGGTREESRGAWSPDGKRIAFNSDRAGDMNLWIAAPDEGEERQLTKGPGGDYQPTWSPDGQRLVFFSSREGPIDVWTVELATGELRRLTHGRNVDVNPFYSPDGASIAFQSDRDDRMEVWIMRADGSEPRQLTHIGVSGHFLRFTPDGSAVIFRCPGQNQVCRVSISGGDPVPLPPVKGGAHMSLSPDGSKIMDVVAHKTLWVSPLDGGAPEAVFEFPEPEARIDYPTWSPDGRWVLFDRFQPQGGDVWVLEGL
ncbi:MAG TPA: protein kinase [Candidatus Eisenbacteria bacterium]|nr:protein kinase [Candidatus Eisenbacteria bacterium]